MQKPDLPRKGTTFVIIVDLLMMLILTINLGLILFDWFYSTNVIQHLLKENTPDFYTWYYENIHANFLLIDMWFVSIYIFELSVRWIIAIVKKTYYRWFFYPFIHWYDVLGSIPVGSFVFLRLLRVFSILIRLHKLRIIDLTRWYIYKKFIKYLSILVEETSDRVVVHVLEDIQDEIRKGTPVTERILKEVIIPQKAALISWLSNKLQQIFSDGYQAHEGEIREYVNQLIAEAVDRNQEISNIEKIPILGSVIAENLESTISDIVHNVIIRIIHDLGSPGNRVAIEDIADLAFESFLAEEGNREINAIVKSVVLEAIERVKDQVKIKQWKLRDLEEEEERLKERLDSLIKEGA